MMKSLLIALLAFATISSYAKVCPKVYVAHAESEIEATEVSKAWRDRPLKVFEDSLAKAGYIVVLGKEDADLIGTQSFGEGFTDRHGDQWGELNLMLFDKNTGETVEKTTVPFKYNDLAGLFIPRRTILATRLGVEEFKGCGK